MCIRDRTKGRDLTQDKFKQSELGHIGIAKPVSTRCGPPMYRSGSRKQKSSDIRIPALCYGTGTVKVEKQEEDKLNVLANKDYTF